MVFLIFRLASGGRPAGGLAGEGTDLVVAIPDGDIDHAANGGSETPVSTPSLDTDVAPRVTAPLDPPTETDPPL